MPAFCCVLVRGLAVAALILSWTTAVAGVPAQDTSGRPPQIKVFLDCDDCFRDFLQSDVVFVDYVRDRNEADVHVLITSIQTGAGGREYTAAFTGLGTHQGVDHSLRAVTTSSDPEDVIRRQLATTLRIGLLTYVAHEGVPQQLEVGVELGSETQRPAVAGDRWNNWVFSLRGETSLEGEESSRERRFEGAVSADRITPEWKITIGSSIEHQHEEFNLDEEDEQPVNVERRERQLNWLAIYGLGEHWSVGTAGELLSSTFSNTAFQAEFLAGVEYNVFPYSTYTKRQLRNIYAAGVRRASYNEETLFGLSRETRGRQEISSTFEQRERWGSIEAEVEFSQYLHDLGKYRLEFNGDISLRIARGFSISAEGRASRIRDQISLPRRGATPEEILLRLRQLRSGYDYDFNIGLTYTFGSIYSAIVNPRFGS